MSKYSTGELAKLCGVSVRTVQYYDDRGILIPSTLSEGGRRLYSEEDLKRMKIICFLRDMDLPINTIAQLLTDEHPEDVIELLLDQQAGLLREEIDLRQDRLEKLNGLRRELKDVEHFSVEAIGDIAHIMENKKKLRRIRMTMLVVGLGVELIEAATIDGSGEYSTLLRIVLPIAKPGIATIALLNALAYWNEWFTSLLYIRQNKILQPLQALLMELQNNVDYLNRMAGQLGAAAINEAAKLPTQSLRMVLVVLIVVPIACAYPFFQRYIVSGLAIGSVKG